MDPVFAERNVNEGFSGGEKKRHEILQMELLQPEDRHPRRDRLRPRRRRAARSSPRASTGPRPTSDIGVLLITHYTRILRYIKPDFVHVFVDGKVVEEGGPELADRLEDEGYDRYLAAAPARRGLIAMPRDDRATPAPRAVQRRGARRHPRGLPDPVAHGARRQAAGLPRLRRHLAEAERGARRRAGLLRAAQRRRAPRGAPARRGGDRRLRGRPRDDRAPSSARRPTRSSSPRTPPRRSTSSPTRSPTPRRRGPRRAARTRRGVGASCSAGRRDRSSPRWSTTPTSCRGRSCAGAPAPRCAGSPSRADGELDLDDARRAGHRAHQGLRVHARLQRARHGQPRAPSWPPGPRGRRPRRPRRVPVGAPPAVDVADARRRLPRVQRAQDARPARHRGALGSAPSSSTPCRRSSPAAR